MIQSKVVPVIAIHLGAAAVIWHSGYRAVFNASMMHGMAGCCFQKVSEKTTFCGSHRRVDSIVKSPESGLPS